MKTETQILAGLLTALGITIAPVVHADEGAHADHTAAPMAMQGGSASSDARDPNAYSGGYTLSSGPYALPGPRELKLADEHLFGSIWIDRLERSFSYKGAATQYEGQAWFGSDKNRLSIKAEGEYAYGVFDDSRNELLWAHAITPYWDTQLGVRQDTGLVPNTTWLAFGLQGLAPYWFHVDAEGYISNQGRAALRLESSYDLYLTQRWVAQPRFEGTAYSKTIEPTISSGVNSATLGLRFRYEVNRQFAPYIGVQWATSPQRTATQVAEGAPAQVTSFVAGLRVWY